MARGNKRQKKAAEEERKRFRASIGFYLEVPGELSKYGVTCEHVTRLTDRILYIESKGKELIKFGQVLDRQTSVTLASNREEVINKVSLAPPDIDIFEINELFNDICRSSFRNVEGRVVNCSLYLGNIRYLYGKPVFQYSIQDGFKASRGQILSDEEHQKFKDAIDLESDFFIRGTQDQFSAEGDSGKIVLREVHENTVEMVGMIKAGEFIGSNGHEDKSLCLCILLSKGIDYLNHLYGKEFRIHSTDKQQTGSGRYIEPGHRILFHMPESQTSTDVVKNIGHLIKFGQVLERQTSVTLDENRETIINCKDLIPPDIDILEINAKLATICRTPCRNENRKMVKCRLYSGNTSDLHGKPIFLYKEEIDEEELCTCFITKIGSILSHIDHQQYKNNVDLDTDFIIRCEQDHASRGDSGRIVAIEVNENVIEIVGIIKAKEFTSPEGYSDSSVSLCMLLSKGIEYINERYGRGIALNLTENHGLKIDRKIQRDHVILYLTPENTKPIDFELFERLLMLSDVFSIQPHITQNLDKMVMFDNNLKQMVLYGEDLESVQYPTADQVCIQQALIACSKMHRGELNQSEKNLKKACRMISCNSSYPMYLFCEVYCYVILFTTRKRQYDKLGTLLEEGISFMEKHKDNYGLPKNCIEFMKCRYSCYWNRTETLYDRLSGENLRN